MSRPTDDGDAGRTGSGARLAELRARIDQFDAELVQLLNRRLECALEIGAIKSAAGMKVYQPEREQEIITHVKAVNPGPLDLSALTRLFERIIDETRRAEREAHEHHQRGDRVSEGD